MSVEEKGEILIDSRIVTSTGYCMRGGGDNFKITEEGNYRHLHLPIC